MYDNGSVAMIRRGVTPATVMRRLLLPGMSGSALIREVRGIRDSIPVVLALAVGANEVLKKPLSARELASSLARVLHA